MLAAAATPCSLALKDLSRAGWQTAVARGSDATSAGSQLTGSLSETTIIPRGQRCSQTLRAWFTEHVGHHFRFDAPMREFVAAADGTSTLGDALRVWHATRDRAPDEIDGQFELNRFTRQWHAQNPGRSRDELLRAWATYRNTPIEARDRI